MQVTVLLGGPSNEREVSLVSGRAVAQGLKEAGHDVFASDISPDDLSALDRQTDVVFPVLHGWFGESGELQDEMERRGVCFVGSGSRSSKLGINKHLTKKRWADCELPVAPSFVAGRDDPRKVAEWIDDLGEASVVKPLDAGSSLGVRLCKSPQEALDATHELLETHNKVMVEKYVHGTELTVGILGSRALSPIRIETDHEFFDYQAKYHGNAARHHFDTGLTEDQVREIKQLGLAAHQALECRDLSRVDLIVDDAGQPWLLEINTMPGFTPRSLLPEAAAWDGVRFGDLVDQLARGARTRFDAGRRAAG